MVALLKEKAMKADDIPIDQPETDAARPRSHRHGHSPAPLVRR
jgi:hypothetical protein